MYYNSTYTFGRIFHRTAQARAFCDILVANIHLILIDNYILTI